jgi:hypothetical protein
MQFCRCNVVEYFQCLGLLLIVYTTLGPQLIPGSGVGSFHSNKQRRGRFDEHADSLRSKSICLSMNSALSRHGLHSRQLFFYFFFFYFL